MKRRNVIISILSGVTLVTLGKLMLTQKSESPKKMPILFLGHGSPMNAIEDNDYTQALIQLGHNLPTPKAIVMISAHWETKGTWVTGMEKPKTIHDFYGFPQALFNIEYPALGDPILANKISESSSEPKIELDLKQWGLDHGTWSALRHMYPEANISVVQISLDMTQPPAYHFELGKKLAFLREQGILIIGSGNIVHNLSNIQWQSDARTFDWAVEFDDWVKDKLLAKNYDPLINDFLKSQSGKLSVPTVEHYLPLLYILGASEKTDRLEFVFKGFQNASISMRCIQFS